MTTNYFQLGDFSNFSGFAIAPMAGNLIVNANYLKQAAGVGGADNQAESQLIHPWINHTSWGFGKAELGDF